MSTATQENLPMTHDLIQDEVERQEEYLNELPDDYDFPLFSGSQAVESQRRSGYRNTARAAREIVDNAIEAGAKNIRIVLDRISEADRGKRKRKNTVSSVAFIDDGPGMRHVPGGKSMIRYALSWGGGTHFKNPEKIGKFGFGLPNSSINQTRRVELYSKTEDSSCWYRGVLDISEVPRHGLLTIPEPEEAKLPEYVQSYLKRKKIDLTSGTVVVWDKPDRLSVSQASSLAEHLRFDFRATYRGVLDGVNIFVESDEPIEKIDPLFLTEDAWLYEPPNTEDPTTGGAQCTFKRSLPVKYYRDKMSGRQHLELLDTVEELEEAQLEEQNPPDDIEDVRVSTFKIRVARFPVGFVEGHGDKKKKEDRTKAHQRFDYRKDRRGMSFIRAGREIDTKDVFPKTSREENSGMGKWPLLQTYAYHWGVECSFGPALDEPFGIGNDKQTVEPIEDFWRVLHEVELDRILNRENAYQRKQRKKEKSTSAKKPESRSPSVQAATQAKKVSGSDPARTKKAKEEAKSALEKAAKARSESTGTSHDEAREAIAEEAKRKRYDIAFSNVPDGVFMRPDWGNGLQVIVDINEAHPFYSYYSDCPDKTRNAVNLLLFALGEAELKGSAQSDDMDPDSDISRQILTDLRVNVLNRFLYNSLGILTDLMPPEDEEASED